MYLILMVYACLISCSLINKSKCHSLAYFNLLWTCVVILHKVYSYISITKAHHIQLKFCTVVVHINNDILVEFHFNSCESSQDMAFSATLPPCSPRIRSKLSMIFLITFALRNYVHFIVAI